ncbi:MAG: GDP-mannose 4,6-dehydratase [Negativicutes bacterium]|nr:GDP-mannose 4,6-dehydratase [Negativicutes bacterium]
MATKTAFITGISGMVGSHLADFLLTNTDWQIVGLIRWRSPLDNIEHLLPEVNRRGRVQLVYGDLNDETSLRRAVRGCRPDYVFHLAAQSYPTTSFTSPIETLNVNVLGTARLLEVLRECQNEEVCRPVVHVCSSSEVFGRVPPDKVPIGEENSFHPASPYAISKAGTDLLGRYYACAFGLCTITTRMFTHTGPRRGDVFAESSFAKQIAMIEQGLLPPVIKAGNLRSLRTWADVRDAVRAYHLLVTVSPVAGEYYNIGGSFSCTIGDMLDHLLGQSTVGGIRVEVEEERLRPVDADLQIPDTSKFVCHTGWQPQYSFEQTMNDLLAYWRAKVAGGKKFLAR